MTDVTVQCIDCKKTISGIITFDGSAGFHVLGPIGPEHRKVYLCDACSGWSMGGTS